MSATKPQGPVFDPGLCRCCGTMKKCRLLTSEYGNAGLKEVYADMLMDCFGLLISYMDGKPSERLICAACVHRLRDATAFKKQVLQCEEAFLQMKMYDAKVEETSKIKLLSEGGSSLIEVEVVKDEPNSAPPSPQQTVDDNTMDNTMDSTEPLEPIKPEDREDSNDDVPLQQLSRARGDPPRNRRGLRIAPIAWHKKAVSMSKIQQMMRERDTSYMVQCNISTIVEYSFVCPFKCRHNHLLCYYCGSNFADPKMLRSHTEEAHQPKWFKVTENRRNMTKMDLTRVDCRLCPAKITDLDEFRRHISSVHSKKYYLHHKDLILPFKLLKDEWKCYLCSLTFPYFHALNKHMNEHYRNYVCETCGLGFVDKGRFVMHQQRHDVAEFPCQTCGKVFKAQYNRDLHIDRVHKKRGRVNCPKCDVMLMSYQQKLKHLVEVHGDAPMSFPCPMCDKIFDSRRTLTIHRRKDHLKDYRYECQFCGQKFFTRFALTNHMPTHTGERNFKCKVCDKSYPRLKTLKEHMRIHTNDRRYRCHICGQAFIQNCSLKGHMKSQHPEYG